MKKRNNRQVHDVADADHYLKDGHGVVPTLVGLVTTVHSISTDNKNSKYSEKMHANVRFNDGKSRIKLRIDTG